MKKLILIIILVLLTQPVYSQKEVNKVGTTAASFLNLEVGARAIALAGAFIAIGNDATTLNYNPAGMAYLDRLAANYTNINLYAGIQHQFIGVVIPVGLNNAFGVGFNFVDIGKIEKTTVFEPDGTGLMFSNYDMSFSISFARQLTDRISFGVTGRWVHEQIWQEKADGISGDIGVIFAPGLSGLKLGMTITNFGPNMAMDQGPLQTFSYEPREDQPGVGNRNLDAKLMVEDYPMPVSFQMGATIDLMGAKSVLLPNTSNRISLIMEVNDAFDSAMRSKWALEYEWRHILALRAGYKQNYDLARFTYGGGLKIPVPGFDLRFDYALADYGDLGNVHVTSIQIGF